MKYTKALIIVLAIITIGAVARTSFFAKQNDLENTSTTSTNIISLLPKINGEGEITVKVSPQDLSQSAKTWDFEILLDTHTQNLGDIDVTGNSVLFDDQGHQFTPISWEELSAREVEAPQQHHRQGVLKFAPIIPRPKSVELKITNIGDIYQRSFKWEL